MYCRKCGKAVGDNDKFCFNCGDLLQGESEQAGKSMQEHQVIEETPMSIADEETPVSIVDEEALIDDSLLEENNKEEITETEDIPDDFNPDDFTKVVKKKFCKKCDRERMLFGKKCWWCGSELETIEQIIKLTPNEMSHKKEEIERKKRIAEQNKKKEEEKRKKLIAEQNKEREKQKQVATTTNADSNDTSIDKIKKNKKIIIFSVLGIVVLMLALGSWVIKENRIATEQQREVELINAKRNFIDKVYEVHWAITSASSKCEDDDIKQSEVFRQHAYGGLNEAVEAYSKSDKVVRDRRDNKNSLDNIDEDMNKYIYTIPPILEKDKEVNEMTELLKEEHEALKEYSEFVTNPYGTYESYSNKSNECKTKLNSLWEKTNTRVRYIANKFNKEHPTKDDNSEENQSNEEAPKPENNQ